MLRLNQGLIGVSLIDIVSYLFLIFGYNLYIRDKYGEMYTMNELNLISEHYTGACSEVKAQAYFLNQDHQCYIPIVQQSCVDFIIEKDSKILKVQVKTATWVKSGNNKYLQCRTKLTNKYKDKKPHELYDILVIIYEDMIWEIPAKDIESSNLSLLNTGKNKTQWGKYLKQDN